MNPTNSAPRHVADDDVEPGHDTDILDALPAHVALLDNRGVIVAVNEGWRRFATANLLQGRAHGVGCNYLDLCDEAQGDDSAEAVQVAAGIRTVLAATATCYSIEYPCHSPREQRWFLLKVAPLADGAKAGAVVMHLDITGRKLAEVALCEQQTIRLTLEAAMRESEQRFSGAFEHASIGVALVAPDGRWLKVNRALCELLGYGEADLLTHAFQDITHPGDLELDLENMRQVLSGAINAYEMEKRYLHADGSIVTALLSVSLVRGDGREPLYFIAQIQDISERKRAEDSLRASEAEFRTLAEALPEIVWVTRPDGWHVHLNQRWMDYTGLTREESLGPGWVTPMHPDDRPRAEQRWQLAIGTGEAYEIEFRLRRADGIYHWMLGRALPLRDPTGGIVKWVGTCTDINDLKVAELEIASSNQGLRESESRVKRLNRVYAMLSQVNALIVRVGHRDELFREATRMAVELGGFRFAWIGLVDKTMDVIRPVASAGDVTDFFEVAPAAIFECAPGGRGRAGRAVREKQAQVSNDFRSQRHKLMKQEMEARGIRAFAIIPLLVGNEAIGMFAMYSEEPGFFDEEEMRLLLELAANLSRAIEQMQTQERLDYLAYYDPLTGLANRALFLERVAQHLRGAAGNGHELALFLIDLERFKNINESLGRTAGDVLLKQVAEWLARRGGDASLLTRVGADQFAAVLPQVRPGGNLARLVEKSMEALANHPFGLDQAVLRIACKVGVALFPSDGDSADQLFQHAESALNSAKAGGDRFLFYSSAMTATVTGNLTLENQLSRALDNGEFVLHYQPKVDLATGKVTSAEALIRWNDPQTGLVPPGQFIPVLEQSGLIHEVGRWALRQAVRDYLRWCDAGLPGVRIAVNVSSLQLRNRGFVAEIERALAVDPRAAAGLELEITESMIMVDIRHGVASLEAIRAMGVSIALDDFGTGFSSLSYLSRLPFDTLKIDRSFVTDMTDTPEGLAIVSTIINLAHSLKHKVVAEGVETEDQVRLLRLLGCDEMQGHFFARPMPCECFESQYLAAPAA